ncbi:hypothetical protein T4E_1778 [Trichinella pseudospiralis]|uniref:Uncharacterized protein n=1 Tax=Trichinella pseudospiralis TaxID=6337 RepID=A0A0V0Y9Y1_TRIPS|nr:hypothetical protein T4E_1778 [Trichinella pseudospiralis]
MLCKVPSETAQKLWNKWPLKLALRVIIREEADIFIKISRQILNQERCGSFHCTSLIGIAIFSKGSITITSTFGEKCF